MERKIMEEDNLEQLRLEALSSMKTNTNREKMGNIIKVQSRNHSRVQLSPRSAAFVSDNNNILNLRKEGISPDRPRSPSIPSHRFKLGRWSKTPSPYKNGTRSANYHKRSERRTPARIEISSPMLTTFSLPDSKSPLLSSKNLRSPAHSKLPKSSFWDSSSRTPRGIQNDRLSSPHFSHKTPIIKIRRSRSRSHSRNLGSRSYRAELTSVYKQRSLRAPQDNRKNRKETNKKRATNRSSSYVMKTIIKHKLPELVVKEKLIPKINEQLDEESKPSRLEEKKTSNELIDENNSSDEDAVIDHFASDESESENEGRFKYNSSSKSNTVGTISFSKLGNNSSISALSDLNDVNHNKSSTYTRKSRDDEYIRGSKNRRKDDRPNRKYGSSQSDKHRYGDRQKSKYPSSVVYVKPKSIDKLSETATNQFVPKHIKSEIKVPPKSTVSSRIAPAVNRKRPRAPSDDDEIVDDANNISTKKSIYLRLGAPTWKN